MPWNPIAPDDVTDQLTPGEVKSLQAIQGSTAILPKILLTAVNSVRAYIRAGGNAMDAEGTIPDQCKQEVIDIAIWNWVKGFPTLKQLQTDARKEAYNAAMATLKEISRKDSGIRVELPATVTEENTPAPVNAVKVVSGNRRQLTRRGTRGL